MWTEYSWPRNAKAPHEAGHGDGSMCQQREVAETKIDRLITAIERLCLLLEAQKPAMAASVGEQGENRLKS